MKTFTTASKMIIVLILLLQTNFKAHCQTTPIQEDSVCLSAEDARVIFKDLQLFQLCDSIRSNQSLQIKHFKEVLKTNDNIILETNKRLSEVTKERNTSNLKLKISTRITMFGVPIALGGGLLIGILIAN